MRQAVQDMRQKAKNDEKERADALAKVEKNEGLASRFAEMEEELQLLRQVCLNYISGSN